MDGEQILRILQKNEGINKGEYGVFSADTIPPVEQYPSAYIVNTDNSNLPGQHWVSFFFENKKKKAEYFDSYGLLPIRRTFLEILPQTFKYSSHMIQGLESITCGEYCIYFLQERAKGKRMQQIISSFSQDTDWNDVKVSKYVSRQKNYVVNTYEREKKRQSQCCTTQDNFRKNTLIDV